MASLAFSLLAAPDARAGSYTETGSGGTSPATITPVADGTYTNPWDAVASSSVSPMSRNGDPTYTIQISPGTLTNTFTWVPASGQTMTTDPPPACVLVEQSSYAQWFVINEGGTGTGSGHCDCGLMGATPVSSTFGGNGPSQSLSAILCSQKSGASFSVSCSPTVSFTGTTGTEGGVKGEARVGGGASTYPITLTIGGTNNPAAGDNRVLTGQQITATLGGIPTSFAVTKYTWSGQSGTCFKTYNDQATSNPLVALASTDLTGPAAGSKTVAPLAFYDSAKEDLTITCTVTLMAPDGKSTVTLTATAPPINVLRPSVKRWDIHTGYVQRVHDQSSNQSGYGLIFPAGSTLPGGEAWDNATIVVPPPFTATGGSGCFAQLVTPDIEVSNADPTKVQPDPNNKLQGLDTSFPYKGYKWDVSGLGANFDGPAVSFMNYNSGGYDGYTQVITNQKFTTWLMYQPPGGVWVPLQSYDWNWGFTSKWDGSLNQWTLFRANPSSTSGDPGYAGADAPKPPQWTLVQTGN